MRAWVEVGVRVVERSIGRAVEGGWEGGIVEEGWGALDAGGRERGVGISEVGGWGVGPATGARSAGIGVRRSGIGGGDGGWS